jgi:hypothetical protein
MLFLAAVEVLEEYGGGHYSWRRRVRDKGI